MGRLSETRRVPEGVKRKNDFLVPVVLQTYKNKIQTSFVQVF